MQQPKISIVIPVFNEARVINETLQQFNGCIQEEVIVVDGGSEDDTVEIVSQIARQNSQIKLFSTLEKGRAKQMNYGARFAQGEILVFLHADTKLPDNYQSLVTETLAESRNILGAFKLKIAGKEPSFRALEFLVNWRSQYLALPYGDQAFFLKKSFFQHLGGFRDLPIMEDFDLVKRAKQEGIVKISAFSVTTSARRWQKLGIWKTTIINQLIILGYYLRVPLDKLKLLYG